MKKKYLNMVVSAILLLIVFFATAVVLGFYARFLVWAFNWF